MSRRLLLTWSDAGVAGPRPAHHGSRPASDRGPVRRLLEQPESAYDEVVVLTIPAGEAPTRALAAELSLPGRVAGARTLAVADPSDYAALFHALGPFVRDVRRQHPSPEWSVDVLLSAGTPQCQTLWVILVQAGLLPARMLQVVPAVFVGPGQRAIREVELGLEGFPEIRALRREVSRLREKLTPSQATLLGDSPPMVLLRQRLSRVARSNAAVLVLGETGTGKELVARAVHAESPRHKGPFVAENCGVFTEGVLASELFGHEAGAFTGATSRRKGVFEQADGGTLFLDEVGELAPRVQAALLRVLQEGTLRRVGGEARIGVDVRVIAATHRDLPRMVREGAFREDLYFRLRGATLEVPPLRARPGDVELLVRTFLERSAERRGEAPLSVSREALRALATYAWPGNVRELEAEVERWAVFCEGTVAEGDLAPELLGQAPRRLGPGDEAQAAAELEPLAARVARVERLALSEALAATGGNLSAAARALGVDRNTLKRKRLEHGV